MNNGHTFGLHPNLEIEQEIIQSVTKSDGIPPLRSSENIFKIKSMSSVSPTTHLLTPPHPTLEHFQITRYKSKKFYATVTELSSRNGIEWTLF